MDSMISVADFTQQQCSEDLMIVYTQREILRSGVGWRLASVC
jgi:hypothetical protein